MSAITPTNIIAVFAIFCRVAGCLLIAPGFSSAMIPPRVRLFVTLAACFALTPLLIETVRPVVGDASGASLLFLIFTETAIGFLIGFLVRLFFIALQFITVGIMQMIGLSAIPGTTMDDGEQVPALTTLYVTTATVIMFAAGLHGQLLRGIVDSYSAFPPGQGLDPQVALTDVADQAAAAFLAVLRIASPFVVYSVIVNFAIGVTNKLTPQIPVFFIATPFVLFGGLFLLLLSVHDFFAYFQTVLATWFVQRF